MAIAVITSKGQMTVPKGIRDSLELKPADRVVIVMEGDYAVLFPLRGTILDAAGSVKSPAGKLPTDFRRIRDHVRNRVGKRRAAQSR